MALDAVSGENREDEALDELLLALLAGDSEEKAEIFQESRSRTSLALALGDGGSRSEPPRRRDDEGIALRLLGVEGLRSGHVSGAGRLALSELAEALSGVAPEAWGSMGPSSAVLDFGSEELPARRLGEAAAFLRHGAEGEVLLHSARVQLQRDLRSVRVVSSEWGQASEAGEWWRLEFELELRADSGRRTRARRALGWAGGSPGLSVSALVDDLFARARLEFDAESAEPGAPPVVLAAGGGAVLFHEAVGHALEGDVAARVGTVLSGRPGLGVAPDFVSVFDDPTLPGRAGSARTDDEGVAARAVALIEGGRVGEPLRDGLRSGFDRSRATGHGRRASHRLPPLPRMSNTFLAAGGADFEELLRPVRDGLLVERLERGSFDPSTGAFRLRVSEARRIEGGRPGRPLQPFWLDGDTLSLLAGIEELGGELAWDDGCGSCGREGQWLPVASGCPAVRLAAGTLRVH